MNSFLHSLRQKIIPRNSKREELARLTQHKFLELCNIYFSGYPTWIKLNELIGDALERQRKQLEKLPIQTSFSFILTNWDSVEFLHEEIKSIQSQTYPAWDLTIIFPEFLSNQLPHALKTLIQADNRIKLNYTPTHTLLNQTNCCATNSTSEFVIFLDHGLCLAPFALAAILQTLKDLPTSDFIYSDEDHLSKSGKRYDPFFKPALSIDYLRSFQYIDHFLIVRKSFGDRLGWIRPEFGNAWQYDLILRAIEQAQSVTHIPQVLYHVMDRPKWQNTATETTANKGANALYAHFLRCELPAEIEKMHLPGLYQIRYNLTQSPLVSIIIPNQEHAGDLERCVDSILAITRYEHFEILIVENNSHSDEIFKLYEQLKNKDKRVRIIDYAQDVFNFSRINNFAVQNTRGEILLFLNNDTKVITPDWIDRMLEYALRPDVGAVGAKLFFSNGLVQHAGIIIGMGNGAGHHFVGATRDFPGYGYNLLVPQNFSAVTAACLMLRRTVFDEINGFDDRFQLSYGDIDLCLKLRTLGYLIVCNPLAQLIHYESRTRGYEVTSQQAARFDREANLFIERWTDFISAGDPFYNPNLTLKNGNYGIRQGACPHQARQAHGILSNEVFTKPKI